MSHINGKKISKRNATISAFCLCPDHVDQGPRKLERPGHPNRVSRNLDTLKARLPRKAASLKHLWVWVETLLHRGQKTGRAAAIRGSTLW